MSNHSGLALGGIDPNSSFSGFSTGIGYNQPQPVIPAKAFSLSQQSTPKFFQQPQQPSTHNTFSNTFNNQLSNSQYKDRLSTYQNSDGYKFNHNMQLAGLGFNALGAYTDYQNLGIAKDQLSLAKAFQNRSIQRDAKAANNIRDNQHATLLALNGSKMDATTLANVNQQHANGRFDESAITS